jgi:hypothetical protein
MTLACRTRRPPLPCSALLFVLGWLACSRDASLAVMTTDAGGADARAEGGGADAGPGEDVIDREASAAVADLAVTDTPIADTSPQPDSGPADTATTMTGVPSADLLPRSACGGPGLPCCPGNLCNDGGCCLNQEICQANGAPCGRAGEVTCHNGSCQDATGASCGGIMEPCCSGGIGCTAPGAGCVSGTCHRCGGDGEACCDTFDFAGETRCSPRFLCSQRLTENPGTCSACGGAGQSCCRGGNPCAAGLGCARPRDQPAVCSTCGAPGAACCPGGGCQDGSTCVGATSGEGTCRPCGGTGQPCCRGTSCGAGLRCASTCEPCGGAGQPCCIWGQGCQPGLACSSGDVHDGICR